MPDYIIKSDAKQTSTLGKVKVLVEQVVGAPSQEAINTAVAEYIEEHPGALSPLSPAVKAALLQIAEKVAYIDENGQDYYDALDAALSAKALLQITAVYTQTMTVIASDSLDILKDDLVVTGYYDDGTSAPIDNYTLSGTLTAGTSTITVTSGNATTTFNVTVSSALYKLPTVPSTTITNGGKTSTVTITKDGLVTISGNDYSGVYIKQDGTVTFTQPQGTTWFSLTAGHHITFRAYDITWSAASGSGQSLAFKWANALASGNLLTATKTIASASSGTDGEAVFDSPTYANDRSLSAFCFQWTANPSAGGTVSFRIEFMVDEVKYF